MSGTVVVTAKDTAVVVSERERSVVVTPPQPQTAVVVRGVPGPRGPQGEIGPAGGSAFTRQSTGALSALRVVWEDDNGVVRPLDAHDDEHIDLVCGLTLTAAPTSGDVTVQRSGPVDESAWSWTPGRVYLGADGSLTQTPAEDDGYDVLIGYAVSPTRLYLDIQDPIHLED